MIRSDSGASELLKRSLTTLALFTLLAGCASHDIDPRGYDQSGTASYYGSRWWYASTTVARTPAAG